MADGLIEVFVDSANVDKAVNGIAAAISDASIGAWFEDSATPYLARRAADRFAKEGDDVTGRWKPLSPATVDIRQQAGYGGAHPINKRTGALEAYIVSSAAKISPTADGMEMVTPGDSSDGELGLKLAMAQKGGTSDWGNPIPARPVLGMNLIDGLALTKLLEVHLETHMALGGLP